MRINIIVFGSMVNGGIARSPDKSPTPVSPVLHSAATRGGPQPTLFSDDNEDMVLCVCIPAFYLCVFVCISV